MGEHKGRYRSIIFQQFNFYYMGKKMENVKIVTFQEDYNSKAGIANKTEPIYEKGSTHAIHQRTVAQLRDKGAKMEVKPFDEQAAIKRAKEAREN